jgi:hypothetical protein
MSKVIALIFATIALIGLGNAFPIMVNDSEHTVVIFGSLVTSNPGADYNILNVDIASNGWIGVQLVDTEDKFYQPNYGTERVSLYDDTPHSDMGIREIYKFKVPQNVEIKNVRVQFRKMDRSDADLIGEPIIVDWESYPTVSDSSVKMTFYSASHKISDMTTFWQFDVKVTNLGNESLTIDSGNFQCTDQSTWMYTSSGSDEIILTAKESLRTTIDFKMSTMSRPAYLGYNDGQVYVDIGSWV